MSKYFGIFNTSGDVQTALEDGVLSNPYVALVDGGLDYNTMSPEPSYIGEWSDDGEGNYTFDILDTDPALWAHETTIATANLFLEGVSTDVDIVLSYESYEWRVVFLPIDGEASNPPEYHFSPGTEDTWDSGVMTDVDSSTASVQVEWDGTDTFEFYQMAQDAPALSLNTINIVGE